METLANAVGGGTALRLSYLKAADELSQAEPVSVITVRLPASIHEMLIDEAAALGEGRHRLSLNRLCVAKLCAGLDDALFRTLLARRAAQQPPGAHFAEPAAPNLLKT